MTIPAKENLIFFENLAKSQSRIWPDAADYGVKLNGNIKDAARENIVALMQTYAYNLERAPHARCPYDEDFKSFSVTTLFIPFEFVEGAYWGVELRVKFEGLTRCGRTDEYLTIDITRTRKTHAEIEGKLYKEAA